MAQTIKLKRSATQNAVPSTSQLELGEVAINTYDGKMYIKKNDGSDSIVEIGGDATSSSGLDLTGNLNLADDVRIVIGDGNDLQIWHDGTRSIINDAGTGDLQFQVGGSAIFDVTTDGIVMEGFPESSYELKGDIDGGIRFTVQAGEALSKGDVVYISGASGDNTVVSKAQANSASTMPAFGLVLADIANGGSGQVVTFGNLYGSGSAALDTSTCSVGDSLYVSATTAGAFTKTAPTGESNLVQNIGKVLRVATSNGVIKVGGAGRTNATPNLNEGKLFVGNSSNQAVADDTVHVDIANSRVGIGTTSPSRKFEIHENTTNLTIGEKSGYSPGTYGPVFETNADALVLPQYAYLKGSQAYIRNESNLMRIHGDSGIKFSYYNGSTTTEGMRLDNSGRFGIGTTTPGYTLDVDGTFQATGNGYFGGNNINFSTAGANIKFNGGGGYISTTTAHALRLQTNNTEALRLTSGQDAVFAGTISSGNITMTGDEFRFVSSTDSNLGMMLRDETYATDEMDITATRLSTGNTPTLGLAGQSGINFYVGGSNVGSFNSSGNYNSTGTISSGNITTSGVFTSSQNQQGFRHIAPDVMSGHTNRNEMTFSWTADETRWYMYPTVDGSGNFGRELSFDYSSEEWSIEGPVTLSSLSTGNITTTGYLRGPSTFTIDPATHGDDTGTVVIAGNLQVDGTTTTINSTTLTVDDKNITLASGSINAAAANGAGLTVDCGSDTDATWTYSSGDDAWKSNKHILAYTNGGTGLFAVGRDANQAIQLDIGDTYNRITAHQDADENQDHVFELIRDFDGTGRSDFKIMNQSSVHMLIDKTGNVGIGTSAPDAKLVVSSGGTTAAHSDTDLLVRHNSAASTTAQIQILSGNTGASNLYFSDTDAYSVGGFQYNHSNNYLAVRVNAAERMRINADGRVGIGTTTPNNKLTVTGAGDGINLTGSGAYLRWNSGDMMIKNEGSYKMGFYTYNATDVAINQRMVIDTNGNVGINETAPAHKLEVSGDGHLIRATGTTSGGSARIGVYNENDGSGNAGAIVYLESSGWGEGFLYIGGHKISAQAGDFNIRAASGLDLTFGNGTTEYARISGSGNFGIGTTSPSVPLHVDGSVRFDISSGENLYLYRSPTSNLTISLGSANTDFSSAGTINFKPEGTTIQKYQFKSADFIVNGPNVGIGTTSPQTALHIYDTPAEILRMQGNDEYAYASFYGTVSASESRLGYMGFANDTGTAADFNFTNNQGGIFNFNAGITTTGTLASPPTIRLSNTTTGFTQGDNVGQIEFYHADPTDFTPGAFGIIRGVAGPSGGEGSIQVLTNMPSEGTDANDVAIEFTGAGAVKISNAFTLPTSDGSGNQVLQTDGSGNVSWASIAGVGTATTISDADGDTKIQTEEGADDDTIRFDTAGTQRMRILSNGLVAIGNGADVPTEKLHVFDNIDNSSVLTTTGTNTRGAIIKIENDNTTAGAWAGFDLRTNTGDARIAAVSTSSDDNDTDLAFIVDDKSAGVGVERLRIKGETGNVGIGSTAPQAVLDLGTATQGRGIAWGGSSGTFHYNTIWSEYSTASIIIGAGLKGATGSATFLNPFTGTYGYAAIELDSFSDDGIKFYTGADASRTKDAAITPTEQMRLDNSGRLGIGTTSPSQKLQVAGTILADTALAASSGNDAIGIGSESTITDTSSTYRIKLVSDSNSAKLTTYSYGSYLTLKAGVDGTNYANNWSKIELRDGGGVGANNAHMKFYTHGDERMIIDNGGNVGIGISSPTKSQHLYYTSTSTSVTAEGLAGGAAGKGLLIQNAGTATDSYANLDFRANNADGRIAYQYKGTTNVGDFHFITDNTNAPQTMLFIKNDGPIGLGTTIPGSRLQVGSATADSSNYITFGKRVTSSESNLPFIGHDSQDGTTSDLGLGARSTSGRIRFYTGNAAAFTASRERMILDTNGKLGIGTSSPRNTLDVNTSNGKWRINDYGGMHFQNTTDSLNERYFHNRSTGDLSIGYAAISNLTGGSGGYAAETYDQVRITAGGNVGIGTTNPNLKLVVSSGTTDHIAQFFSTDNKAAISIKDNDTTVYLSAENARGSFGFSLGTNVNNLNIDSNGNVGVGTNTLSAKLNVEVLGIDTTTTTTSATTQVAIDTMAAATFRSAEFTIQVTNSTDSTYHLTKVLLIHDGTTPGITEYGTVFTGGAAEATFNADISSGNVRLLATPASTDSMTFKVVRHCITV